MPPTVNPNKDWQQSVVGSAPVSTSITSASLQTPPATQYKTPPETPVTSPSVWNTSPMEMTAPENKAQDLVSQIAALNDQNTGESAYRTSQENAQGIPQLTQTQNDLSSRLKALTNEALAIPLQLQNDVQKGGAIVTAGGLQPHQTALLRNNAIQALSTNSLLEASRGNITTAMAMVDRAVAQKYDPIKEQIAAKTANLNLILNSPEYSVAQKNRAQKQLEQQQAQARYIAHQEEEAQAIFSLASQAVAKGASLDIAHRIQDAGSRAEALQILAESGLMAPTTPYTEVSPGATLFDPKTGRAVFTAPTTKTQNAGSTGGIPAPNGTANPTVTYYAQLLKEGKISLSNVPQGIRNQVVLASKGEINKSLSDGALTDIRQSEAAITQLNDLKKKITDNSQYIGPVRGLSAINPWSKARQIQADVNRIRQTVGKALEGGVLRKEDEEKYKKILATITDTPETAEYKIDQLIASITSDIENYKSLQSESGRYVAPTTKQTDLRSKYNY